MSDIDDLTPVPSQPSITEGSKAFSEKTFALWSWIITKLVPAIILLRDLIVNSVTGSFTGASTDSVTVTDTGEVSLTNVGTGLSFMPGTPVRLASTASPLNFIDGVTKTYNASTGAFVMYARSKNGSGTFSNWSLTIIPSGGGLATLGSNKFTGRQALANEVSIASASNLDFSSGDSNQFVVSGTATINSVSMEQGAVVIARFTGACQITHSAGLQVQGGVNYTTASGDILIFTSDGAVVRTIISKADGEPAVISGLIGVGGTSATDYVTLPFRDKTTGVRRTLIIQWGSTVTSGGAGGFTQSLPLTMATAVYYAATAQSDNQAATITGISSTAITGSVVDALVGANSANGITIKWVAWGFA